MKTWRLRLNPRSPWATPWRADSLFGAICWRWRELFPESFESFLEEFRAAGEPPFILSDAFPGDLLPLPIHIELPQGKKDKPKPPRYLPETSFRNLMQTGMPANPEVIGNVIQDSSRVQTAIDRNLGSAALGQLFETDTQHFQRGEDFLSIFIRSDGRIDQVLACLRALVWTGFGKKSSTGLGAFEILGEPEACDWLDQVPGANAFVALSHFVPSHTDPADGCWQVHVTYPKFHANSVSNVFKGGILMLTPGSAFRVKNGSLRPWYGRTIPVPRPEMPKALHYGLCLSAPLVWREDDKA